MSKHIAVWMDHKEAHIFEIHLEKVNELVVAAPHHVHHGRSNGSKGVKEPEDAKRFFHEVARSLEDAVQVLVVGPSTAKLEFLKYAQAHDHSLGPKIIGVETVDRPTDGQLIAYAKTYFERTDQ